MDWKVIAGETGVVEKWIVMLLGCNYDSERGAEIVGWTRMDGRLMKVWNLPVIYSPCVLG